MNFTRCFWISIITAFLPLNGFCSDVFTDMTSLDISKNLRRVEKLLSQPAHYHKKLKGQEISLGTLAHATPEDFTDEYKQDVLYAQQLFQTRSKLENKLKNRGN